jgi:hypothetical protein
MKVVLNEIDDFIEEVKLVAGEGETPVVRFLIDVSENNDNGYTVYFYASFITEDNLICELEINCGKDIMTGYTAGSDQGGEYADQLKASCKEVGVSVRPGRYCED